MGLKNNDKETNDSKTLGSWVLRSSTFHSQGLFLFHVLTINTQWTLHKGLVFLGPLVPKF